MKRFYKFIAGLMFALTILLSVGNVTPVEAAEDYKAYTYKGVTFYYGTYGPSCYIVGADNAWGTVEIPRSMDMYWVTEIKADAFKNNANIVSVIIPENMWYIREGAFSGCVNLKNVVLPNSLQAIEDRAFENTALEKIYIPDTVKKVSATAFKGTVLEGQYVRPVITPEPEQTVTPSPMPTDKPEQTVTPSHDKEVVLVTVTGLNKPGTLYKGDSFGLKGTIKSDEGINTVSGYILDAEGKVVMEVKDTIKNGSYNINKGKVNKDLIFGKLAIGEYIYRVTVSGAGIEEQTLIDSPFKVIKAPTKPKDPTPVPTVKPEVTPEPEPEKPAFEPLPVNSITASVPLNLWVNVDPASEYGMLTGEIEVSNLSKDADITVMLSNSYCTDSSKIMVEDEDGLPSNKSWDDLSKRHAKKYFSIGIAPMRGWDEVFSRNATYIGTDKLTGLGTISKGDTGTIYVTTGFGSSLEEVVDFEVMLGVVIQSVR